MSLWQRLCCSYRFWPQGPPESTKWKFLVAALTSRPRSCLAMQMLLVLSVEAFWDCHLVWMWERLLSYKEVAPMKLQQHLLQVHCTSSGTRWVLLNLGRDLCDECAGTRKSKQRHVIKLYHPSAALCCFMRHWKCSVFFPVLWFVAVNWRNSYIVKTALNDILRMLMQAAVDPVGVWITVLDWQGKISSTSFLIYQLLSVTTQYCSVLGAWTYTWLLKRHIIVLFWHLSHWNIKWFQNLSNRWQVKPKPNPNQKWEYRIFSVSRWTNPLIDVFNTSVTGLHCTTMTGLI